MPVFIQTTDRDDPKVRYTRLRLFQITADKMERLRSGPIRREAFNLIDFDTKTEVTLELDAGVKGGRFPSKVSASGSGGTAKPVGLKTPQQEQPADPTAHKDDSDKL